MHRWEPMAVDGTASDAHAESPSPCLSEEEDDRALEHMAVAFGTDTESSNSSSSEEEEEQVEEEHTGGTPPRSRAVPTRGSMFQKARPELRVTSLQQLLAEKREEDRVQQKRREAVEREEAQYAAQLAEIEGICGSILATVTAMEGELPPLFKRDAGAFLDPAEDDA
jgi:hypothetical protein|eukprot:COSAG03_NODE_887_length_5485_cov_57.389157_4_plen_167_part_00